MCTAARVFADLASGKPGICCFLMASRFSEERLPPQMKREEAVCEGGEGKWVIDWERKRVGNVKCKTSYEVTCLYPEVKL